MNQFIVKEAHVAAHNYEPLPIVLVKGEGIYVWDDAGRRYTDLMSAYSAVSLGHTHPRLVRAITGQAQQLAVCSRAFFTDKLGPFLERVCELTDMDRALPMNTGAEAVETALKAARKWGYNVKGIPHDKAEIITCRGNFHGRTISIVGFSSEAQYRDGFGPFPAGFVSINYGDISALERAITPNTAAFLVEPIQGEAGIVLPPQGYLRECARVCRENNVLLICDEVQTGLGRTGKLLACQHESVHPDAIILGKALGGGMLPVSAFLARQEVMGVFQPGDHGSTFGGNPLAAAVGLEALNVLVEEELVERSALMGDYFIEQLRKLESKLIKDIRGRGLFIALEIEPSLANARQVCERMAHHGLLSKETHDTVVRLAPPLTISKQQIDEALIGLQRALDDLAEQLESA
ncbi:MAG: ornithine--oxo-acid transaminase [Pseudomonadales bacterium]